MTHIRTPRRGFTLIELMIVVAILGILAAIAIPTFTFFVRRSKTAEAAGNLNALFKGASSYYNAELAGEGVSSDVSGYCIVGSAAPSPTTPRAEKQKFAATAETKAIGFTISDYVYYSYSLQSAGAGCGLSPSSPSLYTFRAQGDLDGDLTLSLFELNTGSDASNTLYHARGIYIQDETE